jgi:hypothetical protein
MNSSQKTARGFLSSRLQLKKQREGIKVSSTNSKYLARFFEQMKSPQKRTRGFLSSRLQLKKQREGIKVRLTNSKNLARYFELIVGTLETTRSLLRKSFFLKTMLFEFAQPNRNISSHFSSDSPVPSL